MGRPLPPPPGPDPPKHWRPGGFPNGNGRHARLAADQLLIDRGRPAFTWGALTAETGGDLTGDTPVRRRYLAALRAADRSDLAPLLLFARS